MAKRSLGRKAPGSSAITRPKASAASSHSGRSWPSCAAAAIAHRRLAQVLDEAVRRAKDQGVPSACRAQRISPRAVCSSSTNPVAASTTGHIVARKPVSAVWTKWCQTPVAT
jgi:hypothetical protein